MSLGVEVGIWWEDLGKLEVIMYIINKQLGGGYSFMQNEIFRVNSRKETKNEEVEVWMHY